MRFLAALLTTAIISTSPGLAHAEGVTTLTFETHAAFFSTETGLAHALDPQVFVRASGVAGARGPQGITHAADLRNAWVDDTADAPIFNANAQPLSMTLGQWLGARGTARLTPLSDGSEQIIVSLTGLKPDGEYSLFENHFDRNPIGFTPLDGSGHSNSFRADENGAANIAIVAPGVLTHDNAVLVVFHSDDQTHGQQRGAIGVDAHHQLIARPG